MHLSRHRLRRVLNLLALSIVLLPPVSMIYVGLFTASHRHIEPTDVPSRRVAIVFGAGVRPDGNPTPILADRVAAAVRLYHSGRVSTILMTGDSSRNDYDEVTAMRRYAERLGVPTSDIMLDYAGLSTYESCYRARTTFGLRQAVLVTQRYHLPRAVYTCRVLGIDAVGLGTPDWERYPATVMLFYTVREGLATVWALYMVHITRPLPTFSGPYASIAER